MSLVCYEITVEKLNWSQSWLILDLKNSSDSLVQSCEANLMILVSNLAYESQLQSLISLPNYIKRDIILPGHQLGISSYVLNVKNYWILSQDWCNKFKVFLLVTYSSPGRNHISCFWKFLMFWSSSEAQACEEKLLNFDSATFRFQRVSKQKQIKISKSSDCF